MAHRPKFGTHRAASFVRPKYGSPGSIAQCNRWDGKPHQHIREKTRFHRRKVILESNRAERAHRAK